MDESKNVVVTSENKNENGMRKLLLSLVIVSLMIVAVIVGIVGARSFTKTLYSDVEGDMKSAAHLVEKLYENSYPGDYNLAVSDEDGSLTLYKGSLDITNANSFIDSVKEAYSVDVCIFRKDMCVATTFLNEKGDRILTAQVSKIVNDEIIEGDTEKFYEHILWNNKEYFVYFVPIHNSNGTVFGMYGVFRSREEVKSMILKSVIPIILAVIVVTVLVGIASTTIANGIAKDIKRLQKFMKSLEIGKFDADLPEKLIKRKDELGDLAKSGMKTQRALSLLVEYDALTNLHNRRYGAKKLESVKEKAYGTALGYCVGICDIDFFKKVNDTYGHDGGDEVLRVVAKTLKEGVAGKGHVARWGGEEFLLIFDRVDLDGAIKALSDLLDRIRALDIEYNGQIVKVTMSMGIVKADPKADKDEMLCQADELLYYCKEHGRNQINYADFTTEEHERRSANVGKPRDKSESGRDEPETPKKDEKAADEAKNSEENKNASETAKDDLGDSESNSSSEEINEPKSDFKEATEEKKQEKKRKSTVRKRK